MDDLSQPSGFNPLDLPGNQKKFGRRVPSTQLVPEAGKIPPQALDLEEAVLGALMLEKDALT
jgi:replicative DNA helicase